MKALSIILIVFAFLVLFFGFSISSGAPQETVFVGLGCFILILSRIAQAAGHQREMLNKD